MAQKKMGKRVLTPEELEIAVATVAHVVLGGEHRLDYEGLADIGSDLVEYVEGSEVKFSFDPTVLLDRTKGVAGDKRVTQHPIYGVCYDEGAGLQTFYDVEYMGGGGEDAIHIMEGQNHERRLQVGRWLAEHWPDEDQRMFHQMYLDAVYPIDWEDDENPETQATLGRIDLAIAVIEAGGACTICGVEPKTKGGHIDHIIGCEVVSVGMWMQWHERPDEDGGPSLAEVVAAAENQIARMQ